MANDARSQVYSDVIRRLIERHGYDNDTFSYQLLCFGIMLRRAAIHPGLDIEEIMERMQHYDPIIEEDKYLMGMVDKMVEKRVNIKFVEAEKRARKAEERAEEAEKRVEQAKKEANAQVVEARARAEMGLRRIIHARFPELAKTMLLEVTLPDNQGALDLLLVLIGSASDEEDARKVLSVFVRK